MKKSEFDRIIRLGVNGTPKLDKGAANRGGGQRHQYVCGTEEKQAYRPVIEAETCRSQWRNTSSRHALSVTIQPSHTIACHWVAYQRKVKVGFQLLLNCARNPCIDMSHLANLIHIRTHGALFLERETIEAIEENQMDTCCSKPVI